MKRILFALALVGLLLPAAPRAEAGVDVSIDFFYNNLNDGGNWVDVGDYGYCWQPSIAVSNSKWRPYSDGYWAYTDVGWTWVSYEDFGWATYHYGRWARIRGQGWVWVPGREWGPAWVSWRTGGDHVGWAPLPPRYSDRGGEVVYEGRPISGRVDIDFDIGPEYYNFVDVRYIGEPVLRDRIYEPSQNINYISNTVNVTNITYNNSTVYNYGPDYNTMSAYSTRPIRRMQLERQTNVDFNAGAPSGGFTRVQGDQLVVAAPLQIQRATAQEFAPKVVKTKIEKANVETGWMGVSNPTAKAELQQKMKTENLKAVPPSRLQPIHPEELKKAAVVPGAPPVGGASLAPSGQAAVGASAAPSPGVGNAADQGKLTREQMKQQNADARRAAQGQQAEQIKQATDAKKAERDQQMKQTQDAAVARKAQMQQDAEAKRAAQGQQTEQIKQAAETKKAERDQQMKQTQDAAVARKAQMQQDAEAKRAAQGQQAEQIKQSAEAKKAERDQQMKQSRDAAAARNAQMQQNAEAKRAAQSQQAEQMKQSQEAALTRRAQMQQEAEARKAAQGQQMQQQAEARRAAREQQVQKQQVQQVPPEQQQAQPNQGGGQKKGKKAPPQPGETPQPDQ